MKKQIETNKRQSGERLLEWAYERKKILAWILIGVFFVWLALAVKEITTLLLLSYTIALLLDPIVTKLERLRISRGTATIALGLAIMLAVLLTLLGAIPVLIDEYHNLITSLPDFVRNASEKIGAIIQKRFGFSAQRYLDQIYLYLKNYISALGVEHLKKLLIAVGDTLLAGYSLTLTLLNIVLLPFFVFYIVRDLKALHRFIGSFMLRTVRQEVAATGGEILKHVYAFFKGQITVSLILAGLYAAGFALVGLPYGLIVGFMTGILNLIPYVGMVTGFVVATLITLVTDPSWTQFLLVYGVFAVVQPIEGMFLTPIIVGKSVGIHPLAAMVVLIIGGQLLGLLGIVIAIPAAAAVRVIIRRLLEAVDS